VSLDLNRLDLFDSCKRVHIIPLNAKVSDESQPPMTSDLSLSESAASRSLEVMLAKNPFHLLPLFLIGIFSHPPDS
jgi:hypothetical protein